MFVYDISYNNKYISLYNTCNKWYNYDTHIHQNLYNNSYIKNNTLLFKYNIQIITLKLVAIIMFSMFNITNIFVTIKQLYL